jgi:hypothetical protein
MGAYLTRDPKDSTLRPLTPLCDQDDDKLDYSCSSFIRVYPKKGQFKAGSKCHCMSFFFLSFSVLSLFSRMAMKILLRVNHTALNITRSLMLEKSCQYSLKWMSFTKWSVYPSLIPLTLEHRVVDTTAKYNEHQIIVMVGETGSGKTTQCVLTYRLSSFYQCFD